MLPQNSLSKERKNKLRWLVSLSTIPLLSVVTAFGLVPHSEISAIGSKAIAETIVLPEINPAPTTATHFWRNERVQKGDTLTALLTRLNIQDEVASEFLRTNKGVESFRKLSVGKEVQVETTAAGGLIKLTYLGTPSTQVIVEKKGGVLTVDTQDALLEKRLFVRTGTIKTSLYAATDAAGMPEAAANQLTEIFSGDVDFHHELKRGDKFTAVYEMTYSNGALVKTGRIQAAEFINQGHAYRVVYFPTDDQHGDYYTTEGKSSRKAFLRSPIQFSRVSSGFTMSRFHPVLNRWRAHKGTDFAAAIGTPVKATADGVVSLVGQQGGYGNVVMIKHQGRYTTVYGHLSRFGKYKSGQRVAQGDVIGFVGMTGLASGPHLHYEFKIDGLQRDPLSVALPNARPIDESNKVAFEAMSKQFLARLEMLRNTNLAKLD
ncbi:MAG: peptidoglycan DD-metalloendopeptidase family protein [Gallionella sp.]|nr:peptidoglycan DD-metalloendopeptidase family protein [Gallionella sp.]